MQIKIYTTAIWMTGYFTQMHMAGKLLLMEYVTQLKVVHISIQDILQRKRTPAKITQKCYQKTPANQPKQPRNTASILWEINIISLP